VPAVDRVDCAPAGCDSVCISGTQLPTPSSPPTTPTQHTQQPTTSNQLLTTPNNPQPNHTPQVFSQLLKVPIPVSSAQWTSTPTRYGAAGSPLRGSAAFTGLGGAGGRGLGGGIASTLAGGGGGAAAMGLGGGSPLLSSRYASLAAGL